MEDLSLHILDIVENATAAGATRIEVRVCEDRRADRLELGIKDNGRGMDSRMVARVRDPFVTTRTTRRVGMGLPLLEQSAREAGGDLEIRSTPGAGTEVIARFQASHIDRRPLGDMAETMIALILGHPAVDFSFEHRVDDRATRFDTRELREQLEEVPITDARVLELIRDLLSRPPAGEREAGGGEDDE
ncbi:MAG: ATP-binding protein [Candidatus Eisenbacteria bacterium]